MANVDSRNGKAELDTCQRILAKRQASLDINRSRVASTELAIRLDLEAILHVKRRILELEVMIAGRTK